MSWITRGNIHINLTMTRNQMPDFFGALLESQNPTLVAFARQLESTLSLNDIPSGLDETISLISPEAVKERADLVSTMRAEQDESLRAAGMIR